MYCGLFVIMYRVFLSDCLLKKTTVCSLFLSWQVWQAAICSFNTPILGEEREELFALTILESFDTLSSHENGIFTN